MRTDQIDYSEWHGYLTVENVHAVSDRMRRMLTGQRYTRVDMNHSYTRGGQLPPSLTVSTGHHIYPNWTYEAGGDLDDPVHVRVHDGIATIHISGSQGILLHTVKLDQAIEPMDAIELDHDDPLYSRSATWAVYLTFKNLQEIRWVWRAPAGNRVESVIAIETPLSSDPGDDVDELKRHLNSARQALAMKDEIIETIREREQKAWAAQKASVN